MSFLVNYLSLEKTWKNLDELKLKTDFNFGLYARPSCGVNTIWPQSSSNFSSMSFV
jgi:hypothetical protein